MAIPQRYGRETSEDMRRAGEALGTDLIAEGLTSGYEDLRQADQNLARGINDHVLGGLPVLPTEPAPPPPEPEPQTPQPPVAPISPPQEAQPAAPPGMPVSPSVLKTETERTVLSPEAQAALTRGKALSSEQASQAGALEDARRAKIQAEQEDARVTAQAEQAQAAAALEAEQEAAKAELAAQKVYADAIERARARTEAAEKRVDAAHANAQKDYWADKSTGYKIVQALLTFSSIRSSHDLGEDPNNSPFMRMTREAIERDKEKKLAEVRASKEYLEAARRGPEEARQFLLDARADIQAGTARQVAISLKKAEAMKASRKVDPNRLQVLSEALLAEEQAKTLEAQQGLVDREIQRAAPLNRKVTTTAAPMTAAQAKAAQGDRRLLVRWKGQDYTVSDPVDARQLRAKAGATESLIGQLDELAGYIREYEATPFTLGEKRAKIGANIGRLTGKIKESEELGALDKGVQTLVGSMIQDPTDWKNWLFKGGAKGSLAGIADLKREALSSVENRLAADPATGYQVGQAAAPAGDPDAKLSVAQLRQVIATSKDKALVAKARTLLAAKGQ